MYKKRIAVFKPYNARRNNAFDSGEYHIYKRIHENDKYEVTFFLDDESVSFDGVVNRYIIIKKYISNVLDFLRIKCNISYIKVSYYGNLDFSKYDVVITEGLHYLFLSYFKNFKGKLILHESVTNIQAIKKLKAKVIHRLFKNSIVVCVNSKIPLLYKEQGIHLKTQVLGYALQLE